jgi:Concanavalin A-like lectin/glucanases superfamily/Secretion system C-terminal sorting domain/Domain of unknown function DUF11
MKKQTTYLLFFLFFTAKINAQTCTGNLLQNPGFESDLQNWLGTGGVIESTTNVASGVKSLKMCTNGEIRRQTLPAIGGKTYKLQYTAKTAGTNQNILFSLKYLSSSWQPLDTEFSNFDSPTGFSSNFIQKIAPIGTTWVEISIIKQNTGCVYVDDLCLTENGVVNPTGDCAFGLVGQYTFDGDATDKSGKQNNGTVVGATLSTDRNGVANKAYQFDGNDYIQIPNSPSISSPKNQITIAGWVLNDNPNGAFAMLCKSDAGLMDYRLQYYGNGRNEIELLMDGAVVGLNYILPIGEWFHIAVSGKDGVYKFYKNGAFIGQVNEIPNIVAINKVTDLFLGFDPHNVAEYHLGKLDEIRIYDCSLSDIDILAIYNAEKPVPPSGGADLEVQITADKTIVPQWSNVTYTITAKNAGNTPISSATIQIGGCDATGLKLFDGTYKLVYAGTPTAPSSGTYNQISQIWTITNLNGGATATLILKLFTTGTSEKKIVAFATAQSPNDPDSQPSANSLAACTPTQDDEAVWTINMGQNLAAGTVREQTQGNIQLIDYQLFPNPAGESVFVKIPTEKALSNISIVNQMGILIKTFPSQNNENEVIELDLTEVINGVYFLKIESEGTRVVVRKLVVSRLY